MVETQDANALWQGHHYFDTVEENKTQFVGIFSMLKI